MLCVRRSDADHRHGLCVKPAVRAHHCTRSFFVLAQSDSIMTVVLTALELLFITELDDMVNLFEKSSAQLIELDVASLCRGVEYNDVTRTRSVHLADLHWTAAWTLLHMTPVCVLREIWRLLCGTWSSFALFSRPRTDADDAKAYQIIQTRFQVDIEAQSQDSTQNELESVVQTNIRFTFQP